MAWQFAVSPCRDHVEWARREQQLFASEHWSQVVRALGATPAFAWHPGKRLGLVIPVFSIFSARIGYLGFPVSGERLDDLAAEEVSGLAELASGSLRLSMVRGVRTVGRDPGASATSLLPETRIPDLQIWQPVGKRLKKDLAFAQRRARAAPRAGEPEDAKGCYDLYRKTVEGHGGAARYSQDYFSRLLELSSSSGSLRVFIATAECGDLDGFAVVARSGETAYYLHGAVEGEARSQGLSDLLLLEAVLHAQFLGCKNMSLMASPWAQPGLVRFKGKWGNQTGLVETSDYAATGVGYALRAYAQWKGRKDRRAAAAWLGTR